MTLNETRDGDKVQISIEGRVDNLTSAQLQTAILQAFQKGTEVILDFAKVDYISSAGLRALLLGQKTANSKGGTMKLVNVCENIMQVLVLSGFHKILQIE